MEDHKYIVENIAAKVQYFSKRREPFRVYHGSTNCTRHTEYRRENIVDISALSRVLDINAEARTVLVEPNVPMDRLVEATMRHGLIPPVVMEFPGITVGGGFAGTGGESSSFKYGYFNETVNSVEIVLGNGDVVNASDKEKSDLFHGASGAVGSLGIVTLLEIQLIPAAKYVRVTNHPVRSISKAIEKVKEESLNLELDFLDGILFSKEHGVIITGCLTDDLPTAAQVQKFSGAWDPWYYLHVKETTLHSVEPVVEFIPLAEYLFRYDRGGFWVGASAFKYFRIPFNRFTRWWFDALLHTRMLYRAYHGSGQHRNFVVQDLALPYSTVENFINYTIDSFGIWPLWLCPLRQTQPQTFHPHLPGPGAGGGPEPMLNVGLWGYGPSRYDRFIAKNRELESKIREFGGTKWLYAQAYYTEDEFWDVYDRRWYDGLRKKYNAESLPNVWQKVKVDLNAQKQSAVSSWGRWALQTWPIGGLWGILDAIKSGDYHMSRNSTWKAKSE